MTDVPFDAFCPKCNVMVQARKIAEGHGGPSDDRSADFEDEYLDYCGDSYLVYQCGRCGLPFLIRRSTYMSEDEGGHLNDDVFLYPTDSKLIGEDLPENVKRAYDEARKCLSASAVEACALMCRKTLEVICNSQGVEGRDLATQLKRLHEEGHIDSRLYEWADLIRLAGNDAAHDAEKPVSKEDAQDVLDFTEVIIYYIFSATKRFNELKGRRAKSEK